MWSRERSLLASAATLELVSIEVLRAYLNRRDTQRHVRNVIAGALGDQANRTLVDDLANDAQMTALTASELAEAARRCLRGSTAWRATSCASTSACREACGGASSRCSTCRRARTPPPKPPSPREPEKS
jgi:hypothetical protein